MVGARDGLWVGVGGLAGAHGDGLVEGDVRFCGVPKVSFKYLGFRSLLFCFGSSSLS